MAILLDNPPMRGVQAMNFAASTKAGSPDLVRAGAVWRGRDDLSCRPGLCRKTCGAMIAWYGWSIGRALTRVRAEV